MLILLFFSLFLVGCVSQKEVVYRKVSFADTNGVTTVYYPATMDKYVIADDGKAKLMLVKP
jgi:hypothetical protein